VDAALRDVRGVHNPRPGGADAGELNPTELLNQYVKTNALGKRRPHTQNELIGDTRSYLRSRQRTPHIIAGYFQEEQVRYAKAA
jgi:hypothetical protein